MRIKYPTLEEALDCADSWENSVSLSNQAMFRRVGVVLAREVRRLKSLRISPKEIAQVRSALSAAKSDIWQTARVSEFNLSGKDPLFPNDPPIAGGHVKLIHRAGVDESMQVHQQLCEALGTVAKWQEGAE